jgi:PEGA domain
VRALLVLMVLAGGADAKPRAERKPRRYAMRAVRVGGNAGDEDKAALARDVGNAVEFVIVGNNRDDLVRPDDVGRIEKAHPRLQGCLDARCNLELGELARAERVVWIDITRAGPPGAKADWKVAVSQFAVDSLRDLGVAEMPCKGCTRDELLGNFNLFLDPLFANEPPPLPLCTLSIGSAPAGATVLFDATAVGETPFSHTVAAGSHKVAIEKTDFARAGAEVECAPQAAQKLLFPLAPTPRQAPPADVRARRSLVLEIAGGALVALGAAGVIAGAIDLSLDGKGTCSLSGGHTQCQQLYDTGTEGAALVGAGAATAVGGVIMLALDAVRARPRTLSLRVGPSSVAVVGRF